MVRDFYLRSYNFNGGVLHVVLEDGNIGSGFIFGCMEEAIQRYDHLGAKIAHAMLMMTTTQRRKIYRKTGWIIISPGQKVWRGDL